MKTLETISMAILGIVLVIAVLQRAGQTNQILSGLSGAYVGVINALTGAPRG